MASTREIDPNAWFATMAQPNSWYMVAANLHEQAVRLQRLPSGRVSLVEPGIGTMTWEANNRAVFLLAGFALENAIKAFLVHENPSWVANGRLDKKLRSHKLTKLAQRSVGIPYKKRAAPILAAFEDGLESWGRYPCSLFAHATKFEEPMPKQLWPRYLKLMTRYERGLRTILARPWRGPHGVDRRVVVTGTFFGTEEDDGLDGALDRVYGVLSPRRRRRPRS